MNGQLWPLIFPHPNSLRHRLLPSVLARPKDDPWEPHLRDRLKRRLHLLASLVRFIGDTMLEDDEKWIREVHPWSRSTQFLEADRRAGLRLFRHVYARASCVHNAIPRPCQCVDATFRPLCRNAVPIGQSGNAVSAPIINAPCALATLEMHEWQMKIGGRLGGGNHFMPVGTDTHRVQRQALQHSR